MRAGLLVLALLVPLPHLVAQQSGPQRPATILSALQNMKSADPVARERGFDEASKLLASRRTTASDLDLLRGGMIDLLIAENERNNVPDEKILKAVPSQPGCRNNKDNCADDAEEDKSLSAYLPRLTAKVATFHDERAIPALAGAMGWGDAVRKALLEFGDKALGPVTEQLKSPNYAMRMSALDVSVSLLQAQTDPASRTRIREAIDSLLADHVPVVREHTVQKITCLLDRQDYVPSLEQIAKTDPFKLPGKPLDGGDGGQFFPVRADARRALRTIQSDGACID
jgi:hypothetical protein